MLDNIKIGQYLRGDSWYYRLDPRNKLVITTLFIVLIFLANSWLTYGIVAFFTLAIVLTSGVSLKFFYRSIRPIFILMLFTFFLNLFFLRGGKLLIEIPLIQVYQTSLIYHLISWIALGILLISLIGLVFFKHLEGRLATRTFKYGFLITLLIHVLLMIVFRERTNIWFQWKLPIYQDALINGGFIIIRLIMIISFSSLLTFTTKPTDLTLAIEKVLAPLRVIKVPVSELALMISIALRFIPTLLEETQKILKAQTSRGADFSEGNVKDKIVQIISLLIPMFIISFKRAEDLANAMEARGYVPGAKRTSLRVLRWRLADTFYVLSFLILVSLLITFRVW